MIETTRAFEANTRMIQNQDRMIGGLINRVLAVEFDRRNATRPAMPSPATATDD